MKIANSVYFNNKKRMNSKKHWKIVERVLELTPNFYPPTLCQSTQNRQ